MKSRQQMKWMGGLLAAVAFAGCTGASDEPNTLPVPAPVAPIGGSGEPLELVDAIDLLLVIDNSGSMATEQTRLASELQKVLRILTTGDRTPDLPPEPARSNTARYFHPAKDVHVGIVSTNVGGIDDPQGRGVAIKSCEGYGDGGKLSSDLTVARDGVQSETRFEFEGYAPDEWVLPPLPGCDLPPGPRYLSFLSGAADSEQTATRLGCMARLGVRGCPFEQPLEAMRLALANPGAPGSTFAAGDGIALAAASHNAGFLRQNALLGVLFISDEDDCSIVPEGKLLFDTRIGADAEMKYGVNINMRCGLYGERDGLVRSVDTFVAQLESLKPGHPERIVVSSIVGIPTDVAPGTAIDDILARPDMQFRQDGSTGIPMPSCVRLDPIDPAKTDTSTPPRRFLEFTKRLGTRANVYSICADGYGSALASIVDRMAPLMAP